MNINEFDLIAFDLDGTLAESKLPLDHEMAELLSDLIAQKKMVVASGGAFTQFEKQFLSGLSNVSKDNLKNLYLLPTNGAMLYEYGGSWEKIYEILFSPTEVETIVQALQKALTESGYIPEKIYGIAIENRGSQITFSGCGSEAPLAVKNLWDPDHAKRERIVGILRPLLPDVSLSIGGTTSIDITKKGIDKAYGLSKLMDHIHCPKERVLYIGDALFPGGNDSVVLTLGIQTAPVEDVSATKRLLRDILKKTN